MASSRITRQLIPSVADAGNSCEDFVVRAHEQERRGEQVVDGHVQFSGHSGHGTLRIVKLVSIIDEHTGECLTSLVERSVTASATSASTSTSSGHSQGQAAGRVAPMRPPGW
jgi:hypothetical protein